MQSSRESIPTLTDTDLLILGTGAAGCGAALAAREAGIKTLLVDKGKLESSGCLGGGNDHFLAILNTGAPEDSTEYAVKHYVKPTSGYTPAMVEQWVGAMPHLVAFLEDVGVKLMRRPDGSYLRTPGLGQPEWFINIDEGQLIKRSIAKRLRAMGVDVLDHVMVSRLTTAGGRVTGAMGFNVLDGTFHVIRAKAVILAMGNSANRATTNSTHNPYNTWHSPFNTGSQFVLAFEAGASLVNLDLKQQATLVPKGFGCAGMNGINSAGAHELNAIGERFMGRYHPKMENCPRQYQIYGTYAEQVIGNGPPFHMDMRHIDPGELTHLQYTLMPGDKATFLDYCEQRGIDFATKPMEVELSEIEFSGMLETGETFASTVPGLYNGCVFYTFSGSMGSGYVAGGHAARACAGTGLPDAPPASEIEEEQARVFQPLGTERGIAQDKFEAAVRQVMSYYMGYVRNGQGIRLALERLEMIARHADSVMAADRHQLLLAHEALHLLKSCRLSALATLERRETGRSLYRRSDYPELDPRLDRVLSVRKEDGRPVLTWK